MGELDRNALMFLLNGINYVLYTDTFSRVKKIFDRGSLIDRLSVKINQVKSR